MIQAEKKELRRRIRERIKAEKRVRYADEPEIAARFADSLFTLPELAAARCVMTYLHMTDEIPTTFLLKDFFFRRDGLRQYAREPLRQVVVPYCVGDDIVLYRLSTPSNPEQIPEMLDSEFERGKYGILEPKQALRDRSEHQAEPSAPDFILSPGIAFDAAGGRLGRGAGYYDRFFARLKRNIPLVAAAFEEQLVESIPMEPHDRRVDTIVKMNEVVRVVRR